MFYVSVGGKSLRGKITSGAKDLRDKDFWGKIPIGGKRLGCKRLGGGGGGQKTRG